DRHVRPQQGPPRPHQVVRHRARRRPAAVPAGLPGRGGRVAAQAQRQRPRRRPSGADRPRDRHQGQRGGAGAVRRPGDAMTQAVAGSPVAEPGSDERLARQSLPRRLLGRPELGALLGAVALFVFFSFVADAFLEASSISTVLYASSTFGIMAVGVSLLMIGGEFDLSAGVMVTSSALIAALTAYQFTLNVWAGVAISLVLTLALGMANGLLYIATKLPSFIITLAMFFMLAGLNLGVTKALTGNVASDSVRDMDGFDSARVIFASDVDVLGVQVKVTVFWWLLFVAI